MPATGFELSWFSLPGFADQDADQREQRSGAECNRRGAQAETRARDDQQDGFEHQRRQHRRAKGFRRLNSSGRDAAAQGADEKCQDQRDAQRMSLRVIALDEHRGNTVAEQRRNRSRNEAGEQHLAEGIHFFPNSASSAARAASASPVGAEYAPTLGLK